MRVIPASRLGMLPPYAFDEIRKKVASLRSAGVDVVDLGVGDPVRPTPERVRVRCKEGIEKYAAAGYPPYRGIESFLQAAAEWMHRIMGVDLDPMQEVVATIGSKEAIVHLPLGILDPGDRVLLPSPGYPPYLTGTLFAGGVPIFYPLDAPNGFLPDLDGLKRVLEAPQTGGKVKMMWVCYPNSPTGAVAGRNYYAALLDLLDRYGVILASDEAYADFVYDGEVSSPLQVRKEGVIAFYSLSKRGNMTGYRVGWACGDEALADLLLRVKTNLDSGTAWFVQEAAVEALSDEGPVGEMRCEYRLLRDCLVDALCSAGLEECRPKGALYVWQKAPPGMTGGDLCSALLDPEIAVVAIPGSQLAASLADGRNPGGDYLRFSLTCLPERMQLACDRIRKNLAKAIERIRRG